MFHLAWLACAGDLLQENHPSSFRCVVTACEVTGVYENPFFPRFPQLHGNGLVKMMCWSVGLINFKHSNLVPLWFEMFNPWSL